MFYRLRLQYSRLLSIESRLLPNWKARVESFERSSYDSRDSFCGFYTALIDKVNAKEQVDVVKLLD